MQKYILSNRTQKQLKSELKFNSNVHPIAIFGGAMYLFLSFLVFVFCIIMLSKSNDLNEGSVCVCALESRIHTNKSPVWKLFDERFYSVTMATNQPEWERNTHTHIDREGDREIFTVRKRVCEWAKKRYINHLEYLWIRIAYDEIAPTNPKQGQIHTEIKQCSDETQTDKKYNKTPATKNTVIQLNILLLSLIRWE